MEGAGDILDAIIRKIMVLKEQVDSKFILNFRTNQKLLNL
jgi:hypothetical protein